MNKDHSYSSAPEDAAAETKYLVILAGSAGALEGIRTILAGLPADFPAAVVVLLHRTSNPPMLLENVLQRVSRMPVRSVEPGEYLLPKTIYVVPPDRHMIIDPAHHVELRNGRRIRGARSSANPLIESAAGLFGERLIVVILSGGDGDGTDGVQEARQCGGTVLVQDPASARITACRLPRSPRERPARFFRSRRSRR
jgi:two-component system chemotaxis response regulator CheB